MNLTVYTGPDPDANLRELLMRTPLRVGPVLAVVPDNRTIAEVERTLAIALGRAYTGHRVVTMEGLARAILALSGPVPETVEPQMKRALVAEIVKRRMGEGSTYAKLAGYPGFADILLAFLADIRSVEAPGLFDVPGFYGAKDRPPVHGKTGDPVESAPIRDPELKSLAAVYDVHLKRLGVTDHEGWVMLALAEAPRPFGVSGLHSEKAGAPEHAKPGDPAGDRIERFSGALRGAFIVHGFYDLTDCQARLLERVFAHAGRCAATIVHDPSRPDLFALPGKLLDRFRALGAKVVEVSPPPPAGPGVVYRGFRGGSYEGEWIPGSVQVHTFRSEMSEADWVAGAVRDMLVDGVCDAGEIMIISRVRPGFGSPLHTALARNRVPVEGGVLRPLANHPVARFILSAIEASLMPDNEHLAEAVRKSRFYPACARTRGGPKFTGVPGGAAAEFESLRLLHASAGDPDDRSWNCMVEVGSPEDFVLSVRKMLSILRVNENLDGGGDPERAASERAAYVHFQELLDRFTEFYTPLRRMMQAAEFSRLLRLFLADAFVPELQAPGRGALLADVKCARFVRRRIVFFTGLVIGSFPGRYGVFSLHEPGFARKLREREEREDSLLFAMAMQGAERLFLTFPGIDDEGGDSTMSPYLREIRDRNAGRIETIFHRAVPGAARENIFSDRRGRGETIVRMLREDAARAPLILARIGRGNPAVAALVRRSIERCVHTAEDRGYFLHSEGALEALQRDWGSLRIFGVTDLETYVSCPIRFLFASILRLEVKRVFPGEMDPSDRGIIVHEILARFYRERLKRGEAAFSAGDIEACAREMREVCARVFAEHTGAFEGLHPTAMTVERRFIRNWMETFLAREAEYFRDEPFRPAHLEVEFGRPAGKRSPDNPPLRIGGGGDEVLVGGRIDRIDIDPGENPPRFRIIDYKTGNQEVSAGGLLAGTALQIPLYLKAAAECIVPGFAIHDGVFCLLREMERKGYRELRKPIVGDAWEPYIGIACAKTAEAAACIREGRFPFGECARNGRCEFLSLCRGGRESAGEFPDE
jgi:hypothetical protein